MNQTTERGGSLGKRLFLCMGILGHSGLITKPNASKGEMGVLGALHSAGHALSPTEIAEITNVTTSRTANTLKSLERKGYVTRDINPDDRRGIVVNITGTGSSYERETREGAEKSIDDLLSLMDEKDASKLVELVELLSERVVEKTGMDTPASISS